MDDAADFYGAGNHFVDQQIRGAGNNELTTLTYAPASTQLGVLAQHHKRRMKSGDEVVGCVNIIQSDEMPDFIGVSVGFQ